MADFTFDPEVSPDEEVAETTEGTYTQNTAHATEMKSRLIEFFKHGPRNQALLDAIAEQVQEVEDAFWEMLSAFDLDTATNDQLVLLGKIVGESRLGRSDEDYRAAIRARILVNSSDGKAEQLYEIAEALFPEETYPNVRLLLHELFPASITFYVEGHPGDVSLATIDRLLKAAKAAGVRIDTVLENNGPGFREGFLWSTGSAPENASRGWGSDADDTVGGVWAQVS